MMTQKVASIRRNLGCALVDRRDDLERVLARVKGYLCPCKTRENKAKDSLRFIVFDKENEACLCRESESQEIVETYK